MSKKLFLPCILVLACLAATLSLHAQFAAPSISIAEPVSESSDSIVQLTAEAQGLELLSPAALPRTGTFWVVTSNGFSVPFPCPPRDGLLPTYGISGDIFLVDDTGGQVNAKQPRFQIQTTGNPVESALASLAGSVVDLIGQVQETELGQTMAMAFGLDAAESFSSFAGGDSGGGYSPNNLLSGDDYGTNLWIARPAVTNHFLTGIGSNTLADVQYEIQSRTNLAQTDWQSEGFILGSELNNWTPLSAAQNNRTNLFLRLRSWQDDGSGLPLWWQQQYFGTNGVDPYGNPAGDGWSNLQKFQNGWNPNQFYTPAAPQGLTVRAKQNNSMATVSWLPARGSVIGYSGRFDDGGSTIYTNLNLLPATTSFDANISDLQPDVTHYGGRFVYGVFHVKAHYANGYSAEATANLEDSDQGLQINLVSDRAGNPLFAIAALPPGTSGLRLVREDYGAEYAFGDFSLNTHFDYPLTNAINGLLPIPAADLNSPADAYGNSDYDWWVQPLNASGGTTHHGVTLGSTFGSQPNNRLIPPFADGRGQLKDNLKFLLRAANTNQPFWFRTYNGLYQGSSTVTNPVAYAYAGFYDFDFNTQGLPDNTYYSQYKPVLNSLRPYSDNYIYRNFVYNSGSLTTAGQLKTGLQNRSSIHSLDMPPTNFFLPPTSNWTNLPSVIDGNQSRWLAGIPLGFPSLGYIGIQSGPSAGFVSMQSGVKNIFGLSYVSTLVVSNGPVANTLNPANSTRSANFYYSETAQPQFSTVEYDFWNAASSYPEYYNDGVTLVPNIFPVPGIPGFATTNQSQQFFLSVGSKIQIAGYAKMSIVNGYTNKFAYLDQYFDKAYTTSNGIATTNTTGVLSAYGNFFATEPGDAALITMPDIDTGARGTGIVHCVSLNVDKNHDGVMDLTFSGADATSQNSPMVFWVDNDYDVGPSGGFSGNPLDHDVYSTQFHDFVNSSVVCQRGLEDFARLWICGVPAVSASQGYTVTLTCNAIAGTPAINLYRAEASGGIGYLTDTNVAQSLVGQTKLTTVLANGSYTFPANTFTNNANKFFLFQGAGVGLAQITLTIYQNGNIIAETSVFVDFHDVKDLYEQAHITNVPQTWPQMVDAPTTSSFQVDQYVPAENVGDEKQLITFIHGWRMTQSDYYSFSETMFKRLYWQGFQGRFASLRWPTRSKETDPLPGLDMATYNRSEHIAFNSATGAAAYLNSLRDRYADYTISVAAHSMGNIVMLETLKKLAGANQKPIDNYVLMQAAVPAHCYDATVANLPALINAEQLSPTPDIYRNYGSGVTNALRGGGQIVNFFNPDDYALTAGFIAGIGSWEYNEAFYEAQVDHGPVSMKPNVFLGYSTDGTNALLSPNYWNQSFGSIFWGGFYNSSVTRSVTNVTELMPFVARPRSKAMGAQGNVHGQIHGGEINLNAVFHFGANDYDHSGQFNRNIQDSPIWPFYFQLRTSLFPPTTP